MPQAEHTNRLRLAVVSPFLDKRHGTERVVCEWVSRLDREFETHVYTQRAEDLDLSKITLRRIPRLPGPHLGNFLWWLVGNRCLRWWDRTARGIYPDLVFSPGINCFDADVVAVYVVFASVVRSARSDLRFWRNPIWFWPRIAHRRLYYRLLLWLERRAFSKPGTTFFLPSRRTAGELKSAYGRKDNFTVVYPGIDRQVFNPARRLELRSVARRESKLEEKDLAVLLIGNDWRNKGLPTLLEALALLKDLPIRLLVVGQDEVAPYRQAMRDKGLEEAVEFLPPRKDVVFYYAAADAYVGPSLEDAFALPVAEAMACGLPVIVSPSAGVSEIITDGIDGWILEDPRDASALASKIRQLLSDPALRVRMAAAAARKAEQYDWERSTEQVRAVLWEVLRRKTQSCRRATSWED